MVLKVTQTQLLCAVGRDLNRLPIEQHGSIKTGHRNGGFCAVADDYQMRVGENGEYKSMPSHRYRENLVPLDELNYREDDYFYLLVPRTETLFISADDHPLGTLTRINFEMPRVFAPPPFEVKRVEPSNSTPSAN